MFDNIALDVVIGLVFVYLLYSLLVTIIQEIIANKLSYRAKFLEKAISRMLEDDADATKTNSLRILSKGANSENSFAGTFFNHPLIKYLGEKPSKSKPSYLVSATFSKVIIDLLHGDKTEPGEEIKSKIDDSLKNKKIKWNCSKDSSGVEIKESTNLYLKSIWVDAQGDVERFKTLLENWFNETMDRTTGWYKKYIQVISLLIGLGIAILFNVDTIEIVHKLEKDPKLREQIVQQAGAYLKAHPELEQNKTTKKENATAVVVDTIGMTKAQKDSTIVAAVKLSQINDEEIRERGKKLTEQADSLVNIDLQKTNEILGLGIGSYKWLKCNDCNGGDRFWFFLSSLLGWIITALALSLGAPFWFDLLNKLMKLRTSVAPASGDDKEKKSESSIPAIKRVG